MVMLRTARAGSTSPVPAPWIPTRGRINRKPKPFLGKVVKAGNGQFAVLEVEQTGKGVYRFVVNGALGIEASAKRFAVRGDSVLVLAGEQTKSRSGPHLQERSPAGPV